MLLDRLPGQPFDALAVAEPAGASVSARPGRPMGSPHGGRRLAQPAHPGDAQQGGTHGDETAGALHRSLLDHPRDVEWTGRRAGPAGRAAHHRLRCLDRSHVSRTRRDAGHRHALRVPLCPARRAHQAVAGQRHGAVPGRVLEGEPGRTGVRVQAPRGLAVSQRRSLHRRGREVELPPLPGHRGQAAAGPGEGRGDRRSTPRAIRAARALAGLSRVLCHSGHRRRLDRAQEVHRKGRRGNLQATTGRARALSVRAYDARCRAGARRQRAVLAQEAVHQANRHQGRARPDDAPGHAEDGGGGHRVPDGRRRGADRQGGPEAAPGPRDPLRGLVARLPRAVEPEVPLERSPCPTGGEPGHRQAGHQRSGAHGPLPPDGVDHPERDGIRAAPRSVSV